MLDDENNRAIELTFSNQIYYSNSIFVDDTSLFLKTKSNNPNKAMNILEKYYQISMTKIN